MQQDMTDEQILGLTQELFPEFESFEGTGQPPIGGLNAEIPGEAQAPIEEAPLIDELGGESEELQVPEVIKQVQALKPIYDQSSPEEQLETIRALIG